MGIIGLILKRDPSTMGSSDLSFCCLKGLKGKCGPQYKSKVRIRLCWL